MERSEANARVQSLQKSNSKSYWQVCRKTTQNSSMDIAFFFRSLLVQFFFFSFRPISFVSTVNLKIGRIYDTLLPLICHGMCLLCAFFSNSFDDGISRLINKN